METLERVVVLATMVVGFVLLGGICGAVIRAFVNAWNGAPTL